MKRRNRSFAPVLWLVFVMVVSNFGFLSQLIGSNSNANQPVTEDAYMNTSQYNVDIQIGKDNSYAVTEDIDVNFLTSRHGIYRYVPYKGTISEINTNGDINNIPYYADVTKTSASGPAEIYTENGNYVFQLGDGDQIVTGAQHYTIKYKESPVTNSGYNNAYWNVFPTNWQNVIPAGSTFSITFPKEFNKDMMTLYYGSYGEQKNAESIVSLEWNGTTVSGTLNQDLSVGNGMTFYAPMEDGYFTNVRTILGKNIGPMICMAIIAVLLLVLYFLFGKDKPIIPSIQFQPPQGLDSAAVGYIIDGNISDEDVVSLFIFWADRGFLKIRMTEKNTMAFTKVKELPDDAPAYAKTLFDAVFPGGADSIGKEILTSSMRYRLASTFVTVKEQLKNTYNNIYTTPSKIARLVATAVSVLPMLIFSVLMYEMTFVNGFIFLFPLLYLIGLLLFNSSVDFWYSKTKRGRALSTSAAVGLCIIPLIIMVVIYGIGMLRGNTLNLLPTLLCMAATAIAGMILSGFMKKRSQQCVEWMGYLAGLRDFIETAELERMKVMAQEDPHLFYHILPFAYVFGLSDILLDKMKDLTLPAPNWYAQGTTTGPTFFDYYLMNRMMHTGMPSVSQTISTPRPPAPSSGSSSGGFGSGMSGGFGGGFSGGGFGGGGGGSW